ncbi:glycosyltransferase [Kitasatospora sp. NPDC001175]|uniref:glycosyltransferase n=1 Tax=Kitasatospora sp. NPDC001175 TaxID=3157103 RepID=UPI003CFC12B2
MKVLVAPWSSPGHRYPAIATALELHQRGHDVALLSGTGTDAEAARAAGLDVLTVRRGWTSDLLSRAELVVANGTSAPVLGALLHDRPLLLSPNGGEQRLLAAACLRAGVAAPLDPAAAVPDLRTVTADPALRARVREAGALLRQAESAALAAQAVEEAGR